MAPSRASLSTRPTERLVSSPYHPDRRDLTYGLQAPQPAGSLPRTPAKETDVRYSASWSGLGPTGRLATNCRHRAKLVPPPSGADSPLFSGAVLYSLRSRRQAWESLTPFTMTLSIDGQSDLDGASEPSKSRQSSPKRWAGGNSTSAP